MLSIAFPKKPESYENMIVALCVPSYTHTHTTHTHTHNHHSRMTITHSKQQQVTLGPRVLRTEAAVPALVALAHDQLHALDEQWEHEAAQAKTSTLANRDGSAAAIGGSSSAAKQP